MWPARRAAGLPLPGRGAAGTAGTTPYCRVVPTARAAKSDAAVPEVPPRAPCPCGSGRRYKACHGRSRTPAVAPNRRPFAGRVDEPDLVALREIVPSATAPLILADGSGRSVTLGTVLPVAWPAMVRTDGRKIVAVQTAQRSDDVARDLAQALTAVLEDDAPRGVDDLGAPGPGPSFADLLDPAPLEITVHAGFDWWLDGVEDPGEEALAALADANGKVVPTVRLTSVTAAYWCRIGAKTHLRWALPHDEEPLLDAFARLHASHSFDLGELTRFVGAFRACGLLIPVWDLPGGREAPEVEAPAAALAARLEEAYADRTPLTPDQRSARAGLVSRQLTLR